MSAGAEPRGAAWAAITVPRRRSPAGGRATRRRRPCPAGASRTAAQSLRKRTGTRGPAARGHAGSGGHRCGSGGARARVGGGDAALGRASGDPGAGRSLVSFLPRTARVRHVPQIPGPRQRREEIGARARRGGGCVGTWRSRRRGRAAIVGGGGDRVPDSDARACPQRGRAGRGRTAGPAWTAWEPDACPR